MSSRITNNGLTDLWGDADSFSVNELPQAPARSMTETFVEQLERSLVQVFTDLLYCRDDRVDMEDCDPLSASFRCLPNTAEGRYDTKTHAMSLHFWPSRGVHPMTGQINPLAVDIRMVEEMKAFFTDLEKSFFRHPQEPDDDTPQFAIEHDGTPYVEFIITCRTPHILINVADRYMQAHKLIGMDDAVQVFPSNAGYNDDGTLILDNERDIKDFEDEALGMASVTPHLSKLTAAASGFRAIQNSKTCEPLPFSLDHLARLATRITRGEPEILREEYDDRLLFPREFH